MFKDHTSFRMILLSACFIPVTHISADVLSSTTTADLVEPAGIYESTPSLLTMRVKTVIGTGLCNADVNDGCTLDDVLNDIDGSDDFTPEIKVHMTADDFPDDGLVSNAELRQRGATSRGAPQKSFRIKLDSSDDLWRGERRIQLVKSFWDFSRVRNKLSYDLFTDIPNLPSFQTQFVNFKVEDQGTVEDYGLYTHVEYFGKEYLVQRGWDKDSGVYKAEGFYFKENSALDLDANGEPLNEAAFEKFLEIKRGDDHSKLVEMLAALNNPALDFNTEVFAKYYNKDNYLSWFAVNILLDNYDTNFHNYYLYNPKDTEKFYFVPWDYDLALGALFDTSYTARDDLPRWSKSQANWWGQELHQQFLRQPGNLDLLKEAVLEINNKYLTRANLQAKADAYYNIVFPLVSSSPDINTLYLGGTNPEKIAAYNAVFAGLADKVEANYNQFLEHVNDPMPFNLFAPVANTDESYTFKWTPSETLTGQSIRYDIEISSAASFDSNTIIYSQTGITNTRVTVPWNYSSGNYFYRVIARDRNNPTQSWQVGYDSVDLDGGSPVYGVVAFNALFDNSGSSAYPTGTADTASTTLNTTISIDVLANDSGSGLFLSSTDAWSEKGASVSIINNKINYVPKTGFIGTDRLWYVFKDAQGRGNFSVVTITVSAAASAYPVANADTATTTANNGLTIDVLANDTGSGLMLSSTNAWTQKGGRTSISNNSIVYTPKSDFTGEDKFWYVFEDAQGRTNSGAVTITVTGVVVSAYPGGNPDTATTSLNTGLTSDVLANDTGAGLTLTSTNAWTQKGGRASISNNRISYTPKQGYTGEDKLWYVFEDSQGRTNSAVVTITVTGAAAYPVAYTDNVSTSVDTPVTINVLANDTGGGLSISDVNSYSSSGGRIALVDGKLVFTPKSGYTGTDSFWYVIKDSLDRTNAAKVTVTIN